MPPSGRSQSKLPPDRRAPSGKPDDPENPSPGIAAGDTLGEYATVEGDPDEPQMTATEDGGFIATIGEPAENPRPTHSDEFYANLAEEGGLPDNILDRIATDLLRKIDQDKDARSKRVEQYEMALRRTGLGKDAPGGAQFEGASKVVHPMITEACIDYSSRIMKELMPIAGPCKPKIVGISTSEKTEKAARICEHMNWQITTQIKEARGVLDTTFTQVPLGGAEYVLQYWDHRLKRPCWRCIPIDQVYIPFTAADFYSAHRKTYSETLPDVDFQQRVDQGMYRDWKLSQAPSRPEPSKAQAANDKIEGKEDTAENLDGDREIFTTMTYLEVKDDMLEALGPEAEELEEQDQDSGLFPYLITIDKESRKVLAIYRDWEESDETHEPIEHLYEFGFIPWRGALSIGLGQIIDGLSGAATGALRALLDSAHANNALTAFVLKGSGASGQSRRPQIGEMVEIDAGLETDDIRKRVMAPPFNPPSPVLFQLLGLLQELAKGTVRTSLDETAINTNTNVPVGTQLSRVEEGLVVFSRIHARAHEALNRLLMGLHRLNRLYLPDELTVDAKNKELLIRRQDYEGPCDVQPVSDPTIYSDQQRQGQIVALDQAAQQFPDLYNRREIEKWKLELWKIGDPDRFLNPQPQPQELNAVNESLSLALGKPVVAFPEQDHLAHLQVHLDFTKSPMLGSNPLIAPVYLPGVLKHIAEHLAYFYVRNIVDTVKEAAKTEAHDLMSNDDKVKAMYDELLAEASATAIPEIEQKLEGAMPIIRAAMQLLKSMQPPPPMDPAMAAVQAASAETQRKGAADQAGHALDAAKFQHTVQNDQSRNAVDWARVQAMVDDSVRSSQTRLQQTQMDNQAAEDTAEMRVESGQPSRFSDGASMGRA